MSKYLKAERDIAEHSTAELYKEQKRRETIETKLQNQNKYQDENFLNNKKRSRKRRI